MKATIKTTAILLGIFLMGLILPINIVNAQEITETVYIKMKVDGLSCPFCAYGLEKKLKKIAGSKDVFIELTEGEATMSVPKAQQPTEEQLMEIVKDAGFEPREITFSDKPFKQKKDE